MSYGETRGSKVPPHIRFLARFDPGSPDECWNWKGHVSTRGYGIFVYALPEGMKQKINAHRFAYKFYVGPVSDDLVIDHLCRNRRCVNPGHLEAVSAVENVMRGVGITAQNAAKTLCKRGHPLSGTNLVIRKTGTRQCRICINQKTRDFRKRNRK